MKLVVLAVALVSAARSADAKCAEQHLVPQVEKDAPNGAIVMTSSAPWDADRVDASAWKVRANGTEVAPVIVTLAPGLVVYRLPAGTTTGELVDGKTTLATLGVLSTKVAKLPAPAVKAVQHWNNNDKRRSTKTTVTLVGEPPADAVAIVIADAKGKAMSFGKAQAFGRTAGQPLEVFSHSYCSLVPDGTVEPTVGARVTLFWVDKYGQVSAKSAPIKIVAKK